MCLHGNHFFSKVLNDGKLKFCGLLNLCQIPEKSNLKKCRNIIGGPGIARAEVLIQAYGLGARPFPTLSNFKAVIATHILCINVTIFPFCFSDNSLHVKCFLEGSTLIQKLFFVNLMLKFSWVDPRK